MGGSCSGHDDNPPQLDPTHYRAPLSSRIASTSFLSLKPFIKSPLIRIGGGTLPEMHVQVSPGPTGRRPGAMPICCSGPVTWRFYSAPCTRSGHRGPSRAVPVCTPSVDSEKETQRLGNRAPGRQDSFTVTPVGSSAQALRGGQVVTSQVQPSSDLVSFTE